MTAGLPLLAGVVLGRLAEPVDGVVRLLHGRTVLAAPPVGELCRIVTLPDRLGVLNQPVEGSHGLLDHVGLVEEIHGGARDSLSARLRPSKAR